ncbi:MAG: hypothetical protein ACK52I_37705 [Pseudomonadota bacterium]
MDSFCSAGKRTNRCVWHPGTVPGPARSGPGMGPSASWTVSGASRGLGRRRDGAGPGPTALDGHRLAGASRIPAVDGEAHAQHGAARVRADADLAPELAGTALEVQQSAIDSTTASRARLRTASCVSSTVTPTATTDWRR